jgi:Tol biopolymer transport system component
MKLSLLAAFLFLFLTRFTAANETDLSGGEWGILFTIHNNETNGLYWMRPEDSVPELILDYADFTSATLIRPRANVSPDGQRIALSSIIALSPYYRSTLVDWETRTSTRLSQDDIFRKGFYWSPDSRKLAYLTEIWGSRLHVIDLESGEEQQLASTYDLNRRGGSSYFVSLDWSPDGRRIAMSYFQEQGIASVSDMTIILLNADGSGFRRALKPDEWGFAPSWGNKNILYYICPVRSGRLLQLCALDVERSLTVRVADFSDQLPARGFIKTLDVAPDERMLLGFDDGTGRDQIYLYDFDAAKLTNISETHQINGSYPQWFFR